MLPLTLTPLINAFVRCLRWVVKSAMSDVRMAKVMQEDFIIMIHHRKEAVERALSRTDLLCMLPLTSRTTPRLAGSSAVGEEVCDRLGLPVFEDEVVDGEIRVPSGLSVDDGRDHGDQHDADLHLSAAGGVRRVPDVDGAKERAQGQEGDRRARCLPAEARRAKEGSHGQNV